MSGVGVTKTFTLPSVTIVDGVKEVDQEIVSERLNSGILMREERERVQGQDFTQTRGRYICWSVVWLRI